MDRFCPELDIMTRPDCQTEELLGMVWGDDSPGCGRFAEPGVLEALRMSSLSPDACAEAETRAIQLKLR